LYTPKFVGLAGVAVWRLNALECDSLSKSKRIAACDGASAISQQRLTSLDFFSAELLGFCPPHAGFSLVMIQKSVRIGFRPVTAATASENMSRPRHHERSNSSTRGASPWLGSGMGVIKIAVQHSPI